MAEAPKAYQQLGSLLQQREDLHLAGDLVTFDFSAHLNSAHDEKVIFFVAPKKEVPYQPEGLLAVYRSLELPTRATKTLAPSWQPINETHDGPTQALYFGSKNWNEDLKSYKDLIDPYAYLNFLMRRGLSPHISPFGSQRVATVQVYPNANYADAAFNYVTNDQVQGNRREYKDFLVTAITEAQLALLRGRPVDSFEGISPAIPAPPRGRPNIPTIN